MRIGQYLEGRNQFWLMHLSYGTWTEKDRREHWEYAHDKKPNLIGLDLPEQVRKDWNNMSESEKQALHSKNPNWYDHFEWFCNEMKPNDLVIIANGWDSLLGIGKIKYSKPPYEYRRELRGIFFDHVREVTWDKAEDYDDRIRLPIPLRGFDRTLLKVRANTRFWEILFNVNF